MIDSDYRNYKQTYIQQLAKNKFNVSLNVTKIIADDITTSSKSVTTIFSDSKNNVYALVESKLPMSLMDVRHIVRAIGMKAEGYYPPNGDKDYFAEHGKKAYTTIFPGRNLTGNENTTYYQTLAPYTPALVRIKRVNGEIRRYNPLRLAWQKEYNFSYAHAEVR